MQDNRTTTFRQGDTPREELELPTLHFVVMDNWLDVIGEKAFLSWLKMFTWCDRKGAKQNPSLWNEARIPKSLTKVMKELGVGKDTFYNKILKPLWNVGLIDLEEYGDSDSKGTKPLNIIVYKYPQNKFELSVKPLKMVRDYDKDYSSNAKTFALMKHEKTTNIDKQSEEGDRLLDDENDQSDPRSISERGGVPKQNGGAFQNRTEGGSEIEHNNNLNNIRNTPNDINKNPNLNPMEEESENSMWDTLWNLNIPDYLKIRIKVLLQTNRMDILPTDQLLEIEDAYNYQKEKRFIIPNCDENELYSLNDRQFSNTVLKMLETMKGQKIDSMRALIHNWVQKALDYKYDQYLQFPTRKNNENHNYPFYDWLNTDITETGEE